MLSDARMCFFLETASIKHTGQRITQGIGKDFGFVALALRNINERHRKVAPNRLTNDPQPGSPLPRFNFCFVTQVGHWRGIITELANQLFGFQQSDIIAAWLPLFLFAFLFGLSMDYHVFLLSRIREHWDRTGDNAGSVAYGLSSTAGLITGAALIMVAVFSGFAMGELIELQQMGFGLAVAVLIDATIVRSILVPASMALLGDWNWYLPGWLQWLPSLQVEGAASQAVTPDSAPVPAPSPDSASVPVFRATR